jgi:4-amino-4-deoxy-L-arabinose transferase-like glycosyltransferase
VAALIVTTFVLLAGSAMLRTSTTFDEIVFPAVGARGFHSGDFSMVNDHPRLAQYVYGLPLVAAGVSMPPEEGRHWNWYTRYQYANTLYWASGNSGDRVAVLARLVALAFGAFTVLATFVLARRHMAPGAALFAAALVAFTPDMLAHSGVSYNDVPVTFAILLGAYALDAMVRRPGPRTAAAAAGAFVLAACLKYSGLILVPVAIGLLALEGAGGRWRDATWRAALVRAVGVFVVIVYASIALLYGGDWWLREYMSGIAEMSGPALTRGHTAFLLGERRTGGWWYFFPVAFALKTSAGFQVLAIVAAAAAVLAIRAGAWRAWMGHPARAPAVGALLMLAAMMSARMNVGTRHALPMLPFVCILVAQGVAWWWARGPRIVRTLVAAAFVLMAGSILSYYPYFLSYLSEYVHGRPVHETLVDSNTDWGHGLVALREYMRANGIDRVALAYFGSALPQGYGIDYVPMASYFQLADHAPGGPPPRYLVVSATLLAGSYVADDPYAVLRKEKPVAIVGGSLYVFDSAAPGGR